MKLDGRQEVLRGFADTAAENGHHFFYVLIRETVSAARPRRQIRDPLMDALGEFEK